MPFAEITINRPCNSELLNAYTILNNSRDTVLSFLDAFDSTRSNRNARGTPTDEEQDLLRAMLIFAASGLDSMVKQIIKDALQSVIEIKPGAEQMFKQFVSRRIKRNDIIDNNFIANVISNENPREVLFADLINELSGSSIQSTEQLLKTLSFFDIPSDIIIEDRNKISYIFHARNEIVHEMDIDFSQPNRSRRPRGKRQMINSTKKLLILANKILESVDNILSNQRAI